MLDEFILSGTSQLSSGDASDSICPKGWGIAGYNGDGSYQKLIEITYGMNKTNLILTQSYNEYSAKIRPDEVIMQSLMSFARSGRYQRVKGTIEERIEIASFLVNKISTNIIYVFYYGPTLLNPNGGTSIDNGLSLRCVAKSFIF